MRAKVKENFPLFIIGLSFLLLAVFAVFLMFVSIYNLFTMDGDGARKGSEWKFVQEVVTSVSDVRFGSSLSRDNNMSIDTDKGTFGLHVDEMDYFVTTDKASHLKLSLYEEIRKDPVWIPDFMNEKPKKRVVRSLHINADETQEISKRYADNIGYTLIYTDAKKFSNGLTEHYKQLPEGVTILEMDVFDLPDLYGWD